MNYGSHKPTELIPITGYSYSVYNRLMNQEIRIETRNNMVHFHFISRKLSRYNQDYLFIYSFLYEEREKERERESK